MIQKIYCGENQISIEQKLQNNYGNGGNILADNQMQLNKKYLQNETTLKKSVWKYKRRSINKRNEKGVFYFLAQTS